MCKRRHPAKGKPLEKAFDSHKPVTRRYDAKCIGTTSTGVHYDMGDYPVTSCEKDTCRGRKTPRRGNRFTDGNAWKRFSKLALVVSLLVVFAAIGRYANDLVFVEDTKRAGFFSVEATTPPSFAVLDQPKATQIAKPPLSALMDAASNALPRSGSPTPALTMDASKISNEAEPQLQDTIALSTSFPMATIAQILSTETVDTSAAPSSAFAYTTKEPSVVSQTPSDLLNAAVVGDSESEGDPRYVHVWIPQSGSRYHAKETCSGMQEPKETTLFDAKQQGFAPCLRCKPPE